MYKSIILFLSCFSLFVYHDASGMKRKLSTSFDHLSLGSLPAEHDDACEKTPPHGQDEDDIAYDHRTSKIAESHGEGTTLLRLLNADEINSDNACRINALIAQSLTKQSIEFNRALEVATSKGHTQYIEKFLPYASQQMHFYIRYAIHGKQPAVSLPLILPFTSDLGSIDTVHVNEKKLVEVNKAIADYAMYMAVLPNILTKALQQTIPIPPLHTLIVEYVAMPLQSKK